MPDQPNLISLKLSELHVGQLIDGLNVLIEQWEATANFLATGALAEERVGAEPPIIRECSDLDEALSIAALYREIREAIDTQYEVATGAT